MEITIVFFSWGYWDVSLPLVVSIQSIYSIGCNWTLLQLGCPIRKSPDKKLFASPRSLSQLTTSFIDFTCQGIHHMLLVTWLTPFNKPLIVQIDDILNIIWDIIYIFTTIHFKKQKFYVELTGIEPATLALQTRCSPNWATAPNIRLYSISYNVGLGRLELPTPALSERCSNQLSYKPN